MRQGWNELHKVRFRLLAGILAVGLLLGAVSITLARRAEPQDEAETQQAGQGRDAQEETDPEQTPDADSESAPIPVEVEQEGDIRILIMTADYGALLHESLTVTSDTDFHILYGENLASEELHDAGETVELAPDSALLADGRLRVEPLEDAGRVLLPGVTRGEETDGYRGFLDVTAQDGALAVVNELPLEEYLYSVVPSEMPASYGDEALRAQAVCARTYASYYLDNAAYPEYGAHVDDSTSFQVYNNIREQETTTAAVDATRGWLLVTAEGELVRTYYYSTSCGLGSAGYLAEELRDEETFADFITSVDADAFEAAEPWYRWSYTVEELDAEALSERLRARYADCPEQVLTRGRRIYFSREPKSFDEITSIEITERGEYGVAEELVLETNGGAYKILTENAIRAVLCDGETAAVRQDASRVTMPKLLPSGFFILTIDKEGENVVGYRLTGGGFGHGVGMSQNAAREMAARGYACEEILTAFYDDCMIIK